MFAMAANTVLQTYASKESSESNGTNESYETNGTNETNGDAYVEYQDEIHEYFVINDGMVRP